jgi:hypothetical protein
MMTALVVASALFGCTKAEPEPARAIPAAEKRAAEKRVAIEDTSFRFPAPARLVAIGDLHGDLAATKAALRLADVMDGDDRWKGGATVVVQTGDQLDRGDDEPQILDLLERLSAEAKAAGGALHALNGNHEVMNVQGDFRYVTEDGFRDYHQASPAHGHDHAIQRLPPDQRGRAAAFLSGGSAAARLAARPIAIQVGANVFVHGGLLVQHVDYGIGRINRELEHWMRAPALAPAPSIVTNEQGPIWLRLYSEGVPAASACGELTRVLGRLSAKRLIVGHTVQQQGINSACQGKVWRIDVGLSRYYGERPPAVLEIVGDQTRVLRGGGD